MLRFWRQFGGLACALACAGFLLFLPTLASAGSYPVVACDDADEYAYANNSWIYSTDDSSRTTQVSSCPSSGSSTYTGLGVYDTLGATSDSPEAAWTFTAPSGTTITGVSIDRYLGKFLGPDWRPYGKYDGTVQDTCDYSSGVTCSDSGRVTTDYGNSTIAYGFSCDVFLCTQGSGIHAVWSFIYGATITLSESGAPSFTGDLTGSLTTTSGYHSGTESVSFNGSDSVSGVASASLFVDNVVLSTTANADCNYTYTQPCIDHTDPTDTTFPGSLSYNTSNLSDGTHTVFVRLYDAASNSVDSSSWQITTDKTAPSAPSLSGTTTSTTNDFTVTWSPTSQDVAPYATAYWKVCAQDGSSCGATSSVSGSNVTGIAGITVPSEGSWQLRVWLEDAAGNVNASNYGTATLTYDTDTGSGSGDDDTGGTPTTTSTTPAATTTSTTTATTTTTTTATESTTTTTTTTTNPSSTETSGSLKALKASSSLKIKTARTARGRLKITGTCAKRTYKHRFTLTYTPTDSKSRKTGKARKRRFSCKKGRWALSLRSPAKARHLKLTARYRGDAKVASGKVSKTVRLT